jgi:hypothetical protein
MGAATVAGNSSQGFAPFDAGMYSSAANTAAPVSINSNEINHSIAGANIVPMVVLLGSQGVSSY